MAIKFHQKNRSVTVALQADSGVNFKAPTGSGTLSSVTATIGSDPVFTCTAAPVYIGMEITLTGSNSGALITGYAAGTKYYVSAIQTKTSAGVTGFKLKTARQGGSTITTTGSAGSTGLTFTYASLTGSEVIAATDLSGDRTRETGSYTFLGDNLSREEYTFEKDLYGEFSLTTFNQILNSTATPINPDTNSIWKLLQACGMNIIVDQSSGQVFADNGTESPDYATANLYLSSPDDAVNDKVYKFYDLRGSVDITASISEVPTLKFNMKGNSENPVASPKTSMVFGQQTTSVSPRIQSDTIYKSELIDLSVAVTYPVGLNIALTSNVAAKSQMTLTASAPHGIPVGSVRRARITGFTGDTTYNGEFVVYSISTTKVIYYVKGATGVGSIAGTPVLSIASTDGTNALLPVSFCFGNLNITNFTGFEYARYITGCDQGFSKNAVPFDVSVTMLEDQVGALNVFNPDENISKFFAISLTSGVLSNGALQAGKTNVYMLDKIQLANVKRGTVGDYEGRDVTFRSTGLSMLFWL